MVDGINNAYGAGYGSASYSPAGHQNAVGTITVETSEQKIVARIKQGGSTEAVSLTTYSESVTISLKAAALTAQAQSGQQALATIEQTAAEARDFLKNDAKQKLQLAVNELRLLKLLGQTPAGAKEAARLAKQIADAASEYAQGGGADTSSSSGAAAGGDAAGSTGAAGTGAAGTADGTAAAASTATGTAAAAQAAASTGASSAAGAALPTAASALTAAQQDPFFQEVQAAIGEIKKYLKKTLPALEASPDKKTRELAKKVEKSFNESVAQIAEAEAAFNTETAGGGTGGDVGLGGADSAATAAAAVIAGTYQPVNISA